jgi:O-antigen/teichoic acid export membrane protein
MLLLSTFSMCVLFLGSNSFVGLLPNLTDSQQLRAVQSLQVGGLVIWARLLQQVMVGIGQALQRYDLLSLLTTIQYILLCFGMSTVAWYGGKIVELMQLQAVVGLVVLFSHVLMIRFLFKDISIRPVLNIKKGIAIARYSLMMWLTSLGTVLFARCDRLVVGYLLGYENLGIYAAISDVTVAINSFSALPVQPLVPALSGHITQPDSSSSPLKNQVKQCIEINALVAFSLGAFLIILADSLMHIIVGSSASNVNTFAFKLSALIYTLYSLNAVGFFIVLTLDAKLCMIVQLSSAIFSLLLIAIGAYNFGLTGAVIGNAGFTASLYLVFLGMNKLKIPFKYWFRWLIIPSSIFLTAMITVIIFGSSLPLILNLLATAFTIFLLLIWFMAQQKSIINKFLLKYRN